MYMYMYICIYIYIPIKTGKEIMKLDLDTQSLM